MGLGVFFFLVFLEDLRFLKLEVRVEVIVLNVVFFLGLGFVLLFFLF